ncbi:uncharacterized protein THITE_2107108 [Thermothielavioides terrestris NRRL 8126]|uniref:Uncharacterized protein n=1 Tax=Thermothielavioides terrestris (strain ATCC 38088 / NRRL 8126) TaxID=578455 RepID=G2QSU2_THETT|nr:uncharacterized protein THITE_2107108 [Thermothielavioides terrestris NRRL 8126]AEO62667.1 hypothetical protein THITE_2107108 [Thermothielavioides terrestris NRRL 8126]
MASPTRRSAGSPSPQLHVQIFPLSRPGAPVFFCLRGRARKARIGQDAAPVRASPGAHLGSEPWPEAFARKRETDGVRFASRWIGRLSRKGHLDGQEFRAVSSARHATTFKRRVTLIWKGTQARSVIGLGNLKPHMPKDQEALSTGPCSEALPVPGNIMYLTWVEQKRARQIVVGALWLPSHPWRRKGESCAGRWSGRVSKRRCLSDPLAREQQQLAEHPRTRFSP